MTPRLTVPHAGPRQRPSHVLLTAHRLLVLNDYRAASLFNLDSAALEIAFELPFDTNPYFINDVLVCQLVSYADYGLLAAAVDSRSGRTLWSREGTRAWRPARAARTHLYFKTGQKVLGRLDARTGEVEPLPDHWSCFDVDEQGRAFGCARSGGEIWSEEGPTGVHLPVSYGFNAVRGGFVFSGNTGIPHRFTTSLETGEHVRHEREYARDWMLAAGALITDEWQGSENHAVALDPASGEVLWRTRLAKQGIKVFGPVVELRAIGLVDARTGAVRFRRPFGHSIVCADEHHVVVTSRDSTDVYALT